MKKNMLNGIWFVSKGSARNGEYWIPGNHEPTNDFIVINEATAEARWVVR